MKAEEIINRIIEKRDNLFKDFSFNKNDLKKVKKRDLILFMNRLGKIKLVEIMNREKAEKLINDCEECKETLEKCGNNVIISLENKNEYHILGVLG